MKNCRTLFLVMALFALWTATAFAQNDGLKGNGLPQSKLLYNLEVIAYNGNNCPSGDMIETNTHRIAVKADVNDTTFGSPDNHPGGTLKSDLIRQNDILLTAGEWGVLDGNACIDGVARFRLPTNPCVDSDPTTLGDQCPLADPTFQKYLVYARLVGKLGTGVDVRTCATSPGADAVANTVDDIIVCSTENWLSVRGSATNPKPRFDNVSAELLTVCLDAVFPFDGVCDTRWALFDAPLFEYFWNWNTQGKAHAQLFFMAIPD
jgi:hypothetical protein